MADRDSLLRYRDVALRCNDAAQNVLAAFFAGTYGPYSDGRGDITNDLPVSAFASEEAKEGFRGSWTLELQRACEEWNATALFTRLASGDRVFEAVERAIGLEAKEVFVGRFSALTAHRAAGDYARVVRDRLRGERAKLPIVADLRAQIWKESIQAIKVIDPAGNAENLPEAQVTTKGGRKKSTVKGEARAKIIAALTLHHKYRDGSCLNQEPIGVKELGRQAHVSPSSVNSFFNSQFGKGEGKRKKDGHKNYMVACRDTTSLVTALKMLNGELTPSILLPGREPPTPTGGKHRRGRTPGADLGGSDDE